MGRRSQSAGAVFESLMHFTHSTYRNRGQAMIEHNGVRGEWRSRGKAGRFFKAFPKTMQPCDYHGAIDGRFVAFDAKTTGNKTSWSLGKAGAHQLQHIRQLVEVGGAVGWFAVEVRRLQKMLLRRVFKDTPDGAVRFSFGVFDEVQVDYQGYLIVDQENGMYDWLPLVRKHWL